MLQIGLIGTGHWGPNIARSFELTGRARIRWLCDVSAAHVNRLADRYPEAKTTLDVERILEDPGIDAVAISTPVRTHYELACRSLEAGKHILIEKPITANSEHAIDLIRRAQRKQKILMVGHVFEYNFTIHALKKLIDSGELGDICYLNFERTNLGPVRTDVNVVWDLASHDVSIMHYLLGSTPVDVTARGQAFLNGTIEDAAFATFSFPTGIVAHVNVSWLNPRKVRQITVVGTKKMAVWDDLSMQYPIHIYDKHVELPPQVPDTFFAHKTMAVDGGVYFPNVAVNAPLQSECEHFIHCVQNGASPQSDGYSGLRVVLVLESAMMSMKRGSVVTPIQVPPRSVLDASWDPPGRLQAQTMRLSGV